MFPVFYHHFLNQLCFIIVFSILTSDVYGQSSDQDHVQPMKVTSLLLPQDCDQIELNNNQTQPRFAREEKVTISKLIKLINETIIEVLPGQEEIFVLTTSSVIKLINGEKL